ncbi:MAG: hypothetical protein ACK4TA_17795 [Saprospiraceae bacterium]
MRATKMLMRQTSILLRAIKIALLQTFLLLCAMKIRLLQIIRLPREIFIPPRAMKIALVQIKGLWWAINRIGFAKKQWFYKIITRCLSSNYQASYPLPFAASVKI